MLCGNAFRSPFRAERRPFQCIKTFARINTEINIVNTVHENFGCCEVILGSIEAKVSAFPDRAESPLSLNLSGIWQV